jgi:hypothetical protein
MKNSNTIISLLKYEVEGNVQDALKLLSDEYVMVWMFKSKNTYFPSVKVDKNFNKKIEDAYSYLGREYKIYSMLENGNIVSAEIVESYLDNDSKKIRCTPISFVWTFDEDGKVLTGKHYCDPVISYEDLSAINFNDIYGKEPILIIK